MLFFVRVRIDVARLSELGRKLDGRELDLSALRSTHCLQEDPSVGLGLWEARDRAHLDALLAPLRPYYADVMEIAPVVTAAEARAALGHA